VALVAFDIVHLNPRDLWHNIFLVSFCTGIVRCPRLCNTQKSFQKAIIWTCKFWSESILL